MRVTPDDIKVISQLVKDLCGIILDETKGYLIESRLSSVAEACGCKTFSELYYKARYDTNKSVQTKVIDAITTNETLFFRDTSPFEALQNKVIPDIIDSKAGGAQPRRLRIWSAACSTGQEPYSIAMVIAGLIPDYLKWDIQILATDISDAALKQASLGQYADYEIKRGMQPAMLAKYFTHVGTAYKVRDELRAMISFRPINLLQPFRGSGPYDIIFCRNVAIYFTPADRASLFQRLAAELTPMGYLFAGASESLMDLGPRFAPQHHCRALFYQPNRPTAAPVPPKINPAMTPVLAGKR